MDRDSPSSQQISFIWNREMTDEPVAWKRRGCLIATEPKEVILTKMKAGILMPNFKK